jgi:hypothetical protein
MDIVHIIWTRTIFQGQFFGTQKTPKKRGREPKNASKDGQTSTNPATETQAKRVLRSNTASKM